MTVAERQDPRLNTRRIISEYLAARAKTTGKDLSQGRAVVTAPSLDAAYDGGATVAQIAGLFAFHVERPYDLQGERSRREAATRYMFPAVADLPAKSLQQGTQAVGLVVQSARRYWFAAIGVVVLGSAVLLWPRQRR